MTLVVCFFYMMFLYNFANGYPSRFGKNIEIAGTYVSNNNVPIINTKNGIMPRITTSNVVSPTRDATNRFTPKGGVMKPIAKFVTIMIPKCTGSTPKAVTTGNSMGAKIMMAHTVSIKQPTNNNNKLIKSNINTLLSVIVVNNVATVVGIRPKVNTLENAVAQPITTKIVAVVSQDLFVMSNN